MSMTMMKIATTKLMTNDHDEDDDLRQLGDLGPAQLPVTMLLCPVGAGNEEGGDPPGHSCLKPRWLWNIVAMKTLKHHM